jgi:hypothetical protein
VINNWFDGGIMINTATPNTDIGKINNNWFGRNCYYQVRAIPLTLSRRYDNLRDDW